MAGLKWATLEETCEVLTFLSLADQPLQKPVSHQDIFCDSEQSTNLLGCVTPLLLQEGTRWADSLAL